jgi:hypothetical protein
MKDYKRKLEMSLVPMKLPEKFCQYLVQFGQLLKQEQSVMDL